MRVLWRADVWRKELRPACLISSSRRSPTLTGSRPSSTPVPSRCTAPARRPRERVRQWFALPRLDPDADMRLAIGEDGTAEGYADVSGPEDGAAKAWIDLRVLPGSAERSERALRVGAGASAQTASGRGDPQFFVAERDEGSQRARRVPPAMQWCARRSRWSARSAASSTAPVWPGGLEARSFEPPRRRGGSRRTTWRRSPTTGDTHRVVRGLAAPRISVSDEDTSLWRVAWDGDEIAGVCINRPGGARTTTSRLGRRARRPAAVAPAGLGEALLRESFALFAERGKRRPASGSTRENTTGAVALYERVGIHVVRRSDTWERTV